MSDFNSDLVSDISYLIYKAISPSNKVYIGITKKTLIERRKEHEYHCKSNKKRIFYNALRKYNLNFKWEIIEQNLSKADANKKEIEYIFKYKSTDRKFGYNQAKGGFAGDIMSEKSRKKWHESMQKYYNDPKYIEKISIVKKESLLKDPNSNQKQKSYIDSYFSKLENREKHKKITKISNNQRDSKLKRSKAKGGKAFYCIETGEYFELLQDAADRFEVDKRMIHCVLKYPKRYKTILRKYTFKYIEEKEG